MKKDKNADQIIKATEESSITQRTEITTNQMQTLSTDNVAEADNAVSSSEFTSTLASTENQELENVSLSDETPVSVPQNTTKKQMLSKNETQHSLNTKTMKQQFSALKQDAKSNNKAADDDSYILYVILAFIIPPLAVFLYEGSEWTQRCTINLILTLLCGIPGLIHALVIILGKR
jgi:uncharacterized membrane protein YqaE (UPF0057 family)